MGSLNLDKRRAERDDKPHRVTIDDQEWELPGRLPLCVAEDLTTGSIRSIIAVLFGSAVGEAAKAGIEDQTRAANAYDRAVERTVARLAPLFDRDLMEVVLDELYDMNDGKAKKKAPKDQAPT